MIKKSFIATITILLMLISTMQVVKEARANPNGFDLAMDFEILSPQQNGTYNTPSVNFSFIFGVKEEFDNHLYLNYSIDGQAEIEETLISENIEHRNTFQYNTKLPILSNGQHILNITLAYYPLKDYPSTDFPGASLKMYPGVIFHIDTSAPSDIDTVPPKIEFLGINKETADWLFNFTVNEPITWVGYSLDNQANITIDGNFVPKELSIGNHNMMVYAKDTAGNIGAQYLGFLVDRPATLGFFIDKPDPVENSDTTDKPGTADRPNLFPTIAIVVSIATVAIVGIGILIYFKKHKPTAT